VSANEQMILVDESGIPIRGEMLTALMVNMVLTNHPRGTVVVRFMLPAQWNRLPVATMAE